MMFLIVFVFFVFSEHLQVAVVFVGFLLSSMLVKAIKDRHPCLFPTFVPLEDFASFPCKSPPTRTTKRGSDLRSGIALASLATCKAWSSVSQGARQLVKSCSRRGKRRASKGKSPGETVREVSLGNGKESKEKTMS